VKKRKRLGKTATDTLQREGGTKTIRKGKVVEGKGYEEKSNFRKGERREKKPTPKYVWGGGFREEKKKEKRESVPLIYTNPGKVGKGILGVSSFGRICATRRKEIGKIGKSRDGRGPFWPGGKKKRGERGES